MPTVSAHVAATLARHIDHVFGVMGNGNAYFLDALERSTDVGYTAVRHEAGGGRRRRRVPPRRRRTRRRDRHLRRRLHQHPHRTRRGRAGARAARARRRRRADLRSAPLGRRPDRARLRGRRPHLHRRASGCRGHHDHRDRARADLPRADGAGDPLRRRRARGGTRPRGTRTAPSRSRWHPPAPSRAEPCDEIAAALAGAERPFLLAGRGAWIAGAGDALGELADATGALTASTALGRGVFPRSEYDLGVTGGFGADGAMELVREADVAVVFGASLNQFTMRFGELFAPGTRVFQVDVAPAATHPHVGGFVRGDAGVVARALVDALRRARPPSGWREWVDVAAARAYAPGDDLAPDGRLDPRSVATRIGELLPQDRVVVSDGGHFIGWANMYWPVASPDRMMMVGTAFQSIGLGFPSVAGAAQARPDADDRAHHGRRRRAHGPRRPRVRGAGRRRPRHRGRLERRRLRRRGEPLRAQGPRRGADADPRGRLRRARRPRSAPRASSCAPSPTSTGCRRGRRRMPASRPFLLLDCRISGSVVAPYQQEIIRVNS